MQTSYILVKPRKGYTGFAEIEWQIYAYRGFRCSVMIYSGTETECRDILSGKDFEVR